MIHLDDILEACGGRVIGPIHARAFPAFCHDTRLLNPGELFVAVTTPCLLYTSPSPRDS